MVNVQSTEVQKESFAGAVASTNAATNVATNRDLLLKEAATPEVVRGINLKAHDPAKSVASHYKKVYTFEVPEGSEVKFSYIRQDADGTATRQFSLPEGYLHTNDNKNTYVERKTVDGKQYYTVGVFNKFEGEINIETCGRNYNFAKDANKTEYHTLEARKPGQPIHTAESYEKRVQAIIEKKADAQKLLETKHEEALAKVRDRIRGYEKIAEESKAKYEKAGFWSSMSGESGALNQSYLADKVMLDQYKDKERMLISEHEASTRNQERTERYLKNAAMFASHKQYDRAATMLIQAEQSVAVANVVVRSDTKVDTSQSNKLLRDSNEQIVKADKYLEQTQKNMRTVRNASIVAAGTILTGGALAAAAGGTTAVAGTAVAVSGGTAAAGATTAAATTAVAGSGATAFVTGAGASMLKVGLEVAAIGVLSSTAEGLGDLAYGNKTTDQVVDNIGNQMVEDFKTGAVTAGTTIMGGKIATSVAGYIPSATGNLIARAASGAAAGSGTATALTTVDYARARLEARAEFDELYQYSQIAEQEKEAIYQAMLEERGLTDEQILAGLGTTAVKGAAIGAVGGASSVTAAGGGQYAQAISHAKGYSASLATSAVTRAINGEAIIDPLTVSDATVSYVSGNVNARAGTGLNRVKPGTDMVKKEYRMQTVHVEPKPKAAPAEEPSPSKAKPTHEEASSNPNPEPQQGRTSGRHRNPNSHFDPRNNPGKNPGPTKNERNFKGTKGFKSPYDIVSENDAYEVLEIDIKAKPTFAEMETVMRREWKRTHPDLGGNAEEFKKVEKASEILRKIHNVK